MNFNTRSISKIIIKKPDANLRSRYNLSLVYLKQKLGSFENYPINIKNYAEDIFEPMQVMEELQLMSPSVCFFITNIIH